MQQGFSEKKHQPGAGDAAGELVLHPDFVELEKLERIAHRMDTLFRLPIINTRVGLDSILGLIPGIGDTATLLPAAYIVYRGHRMGVPTSTKLRMGVNSAIDWVIGSVPLVGDLFDVGFKANRRNVALIRSHLEQRHSEQAQLSRRYAKEKGAPAGTPSHRSNFV